MQNLRRNAGIVALVGLVLAAAAVPAAAQDAGTPWIHVEVRENGDGGSRVHVNVPLTLAEVALRFAPDDILEDGMLRIDEFAENDFKVEDLRAVWNELKAAGDGEFVTVESDEETVSVARVGELLQVRVSNGPDGEQVQVDAPIEVVDALLSGTGERLNVRAALETLKGRPGEIVRVQDGESHVRVWIDLRT